MPDNQDYAALGELLAHPERWSEAEAERARTLRESQAAIARAHDQRDTRRVNSLWAVVRELDDALGAWEATR